MRPRHGGDVRASIDASVNINPCGPPHQLEAVFDRVRELASRYPEIDAGSARAAWATRLGVDVREIVIGNGASELISLAVRAVAPERVVVFDPTYSEYAAAAHANGIGVLRLPYVRDPEGGWTLPGAPEIGPGDLVFVCSPNNPTGTVVDLDGIRALAATGARVVVDESFAALLPTPSPTAAGLRSLGVITVTSLTKSYAIPGLRLGYLVADLATVAGIERIRDPWSVNGLATAAAEVLADPSVDLAESRAFIARERGRLASECERMGLIVHAADVPWLLVELPESVGHTASSLVAAVREQGIALRDASNFPGLDHRFVRIGVRTADENTHIVTALEAVLAGPSDAT